MNEQDKRERELYGIPHSPIDDTALNDILINHKMWLESDGKNGKRANLHLTDLSKKDLSNANFRKAILHGAKFDNSDLINTDFREASLNPYHADTKGEVITSFISTKLINAKFQNAAMYKCIFSKSNLYQSNFRNANLEKAAFNNADLTETILTEAVLKDADLNNSSGLSINDLAGTDVTNTVLPKHIESFDSVRNIEESSKISKKLFIMLILACFYSLVTIATTSDEAILLNTSNLTLPVIGNSLPTVWFYLITPILLFIFQIYFLINLYRNWKLIAFLPSIFPDGKTIDEKIYPWFLNHIVLSYSKLISFRRPKFSKLQNFIIIILTWYFMPTTIILFSFKYYKRGDMNGIYLIFFLFVLSVLISMFSFMYSKMAFIHVKRIDFNLSFAKKFCVSIVLIITLLGFFVFHEIIFKANIFSNPYFKVNLVNAKMEWVDLSNKNLQGAIFKGANLHGSNLENSNLKYADLRGSNLKGVNFKNAVLDSALLNEAILINADLENASLIGADLTMANIENANITHTNFQGSQLSYTKGIPTGISSKARNLVLAYTEGEVVSLGRRHVGVHNEFLAVKNLSNYDLQGCNMFGADLSGYNLISADFRNAILDSANLIGADLQGARNLTENQLKHAIIDSTTKLPDYLNK